MKKFFKNILLTFIMLFSLLGTTSCFPGLIFIDTGRDDALSKIENFLDALEKNDKERIRKQFAPIILVEQDGFDDDLNSLIEYFDGEVEDYTMGSVFEEEESEYGKVKEWHRTSSDVTTTVDIFRMYFYWCVRDTEEKRNVGLVSYYIIKFDDDYDPTTHLYGGDGLRTPGINIGIAVKYE